MTSFNAAYAEYVDDTTILSVVTNSDHTST